jgi:outer membrane immunogenic protein
MMKKVTTALLLSALTIGTTQATIKTGFYAGLNGGYGSTAGKNSAQSGPGNIDVGGHTGNFGLHGGYGWIVGCIYYGGELGYTFERTSVRDHLIPAGTGTNGMEIKRNGYFRAALRGGYLFTPSTMIYLLLGGHWGKWEIRDDFLPFTNANPGTGSNTSFHIAPGFGMETAIMPCVYFRTEYAYEFGPSLRASNGTGNGSRVNTIRTHAVKVGISYKF